MEKQDKGKLIVSAAKTLKGYRLDDSRIASFSLRNVRCGPFWAFCIRDQI